MIQTAFDTLDFANKLKAAGLAPQIAETQAELQAEIQNNLIKHELATKEDLKLLECKLESKIDSVESRLLVKLGGIMVGCSALLGTLTTLLHVTH
jgi:hypothetical protein